MQDSNEIIDHLYLGNKNSLSNFESCGLVVNCTNDLKIDERFDTIRLAVKDDPFESKKLFQLILETNVLEKIHNQLKKQEDVLVHCSMGMQRSCAVVACYLILYHRMDVDGAIEFIKSKRRIAFFGQINFLETLQLCFKKSKQT
jgi:protein-tyrosine phosphatase